MVSGTPERTARWVAEQVEDDGSRYSAAHEHGLPPGEEHAMPFPQRARRTFSTTARLTATETRLLDALTMALHRSQSEVFGLALRCLAERHSIPIAQPEVLAEAGDARPARDGSLHFPA